MIFCYHTEILSPWANDELQQKMELIPDGIKRQILLKRNHLDVQLSVCGNLLILALIKHFEVDLTLAEIVYNDYKRPYFNDGFDFNISHSGNRVVGCATLNGKVGIDIELTKPINLNYDDYFTTTEQQKIRTAKNPDTEFFNYWTRKEALLKAVGTGVYTYSFIYKGDNYHLSPIDIAADYKACVAYTAEQEISIQEFFI
jgi:4'-phosphopantetheinyl transferase